MREQRGRSRSKRSAKSSKKRPVISGETIEWVSRIVKHIATQKRKTARLLREWEEEEKKVRRLLIRLQGMRS
jgi:hypothetical protein